MEKFKTNRFPSLTSTPKMRKRVLLKDGKPVTQPGEKEKEKRNAGAVQSGAGSSGAGSSRGRTVDKALSQKQLKKMFEAR